MRILRLRRGFQADHSSSSYLFYALDPPVSAKGQSLAHRYSSRAEVGERTARYQKWGDSELRGDAYKTLLGEHYDVMASESYDWWTLSIAVAKTPDMEAVLAPFRDARRSRAGGAGLRRRARHVAVTPEGDVYPCSHLRRPAYRLGNLLHDDREQLWNAGLGWQGRQRYMASCRGPVCPCCLSEVNRDKTGNLELQQER